MRELEMFVDLLGAVRGVEECDEDTDVESVDLYISGYRAGLDTAIRLAVTVREGLEAENLEEPQCESCAGHDENGQW